MTNKVKKLFNDYFDSSVWTVHTNEFQISDLYRAYQAGFDQGLKYGYSDGYDEGLHVGMDDGWNQAQ